MDRAETLNRTGGEAGQTKWLEMTETERDGTERLNRANRPVLGQTESLDRAETLNRTGGEAGQTKWLEMTETERDGTERLDRKNRLVGQTKWLEITERRGRTRQRGWTGQIN